MIGLNLTFAGKGWGVGYFKGFWGADTKRSDYAKWTEAERRDQWAGAVEKLSEALTLAKKNHVGELVGVPVEVTTDGGTLKEWRVLTEVIR